MAKKVYAIKEGFDSKKNIQVKNIIVNTWSECLSYVKGVKGAKYKSFTTLSEAQTFLNDSNDVIKKEEGGYPEDCLHIYVDGSYNIATEEYSYGLVAVKNNVVEYIESGASKSDEAKNIRQIAGELEAAIKGVKYALKNKENKVVIFHDYIGICYHATGFWERKEESSIKYYNKMQDFMKNGIEIIFVKVDSHTGDLFNELADEKCKEKLGIESDHIVSKWLDKSIIKVANKELVKEINTLVKGESNNVKVVGDCSDTVDINKELENQIINIIKGMTVKEKKEILNYLKTQ